MDLPTFIALYYTNTPPNASIGKKNTNRGFTKPPTNLQERAPYAKNENIKNIESHKQMSKHEHWM